MKNKYIGAFQEEKTIGQQYVEWKARKLIKDLINQLDNASEDEKKLEIAGRIISLVQKVML